MRTTRIRGVDEVLLEVLQECNVPLLCVLQMHLCGVLTHRCDHSHVDDSVESLCSRMYIAWASVAGRLPVTLL